MINRSLKQNMEQWLKDLIEITLGMLFQYRAIATHTGIYNDTLLGMFEVEFQGKREIVELNLSLKSLILTVTCQGNSAYFNLDGKLFDIGEVITDMVNDNFGI